MIDLTPLDVRKKRGDFQKGLRGYDPQEVDTFLELVAERMEELVKEVGSLRERSEALDERVRAYDRRERAVQEALVTAQKLRDDIQAQAQREADLARREAESASDVKRREAEAQAHQIVRDAEARLTEHERALEDLMKRRKGFLRSFRRFLENELEAVVTEQETGPPEPESSPPIGIPLSQRDLLE